MSSTFEQYFYRCFDYLNFGVEYILVIPINTALSLYIMIRSLLYSGLFPTLVVSFGSKDENSITTVLY